MIEAILLDVDNTLLDFNACARESMISACQALDVSWSEAMFSVFLRVNDALWREIEAGRLTVEELYRRRWSSIFRELGIPGDGEAFERCFLSYLEESACPVEGALELVAYLSEKYTLCVASNAPYEQQCGRLARAGLLPWFQHLFISERIGAAKPSKAFFDACLAELALEREEVMIIGDSLTADIQGGADYGLKTCWFCPDGLEPKLVPADHRVSTLTEIKSFL